MLGTSTARFRQILILICLLCILLCSLIIMGLVGVNGKITFGRSFSKGCLLYMTIDGDVTTYNNGFCLFPIVAAAVTAVFALLFMVFLSLYGAQITAGIMGGFWLITTLLEVFQLKGRPHHVTTNTVDIAGQTTVVPSTKKKSSHGISTSNISSPNLISTSTSAAHLTSAPTPAPAPAHVHRDGNHQPEMTSYQVHDNNNQFQQQYYQPTPMPQPQQLQQQQYYQQTPQQEYYQQTPRQ
ncbi:hypothetical protein BG015_009799 [Linnemannia schmuckeri]|uniref:Uncharacterized protein n=1 Tax=Linnemannia schmuckeri TaxID=64567 RepID=A0A9P5RVE4_9FUNG|nr:hypothetical protein BG015_009799 [Linnemannia schmuckeri]